MSADPVVPLTATSKSATAVPARPVAVRRRERGAELLLHFAAAVLSVLLVYLAMDLARADLHVPFSYEGDGLLNTAIIKGIVENGWYQQNPSLGAPGMQRLYDYPVGDNLCCVMMKALSWFTPDPSMIGNLFFLLTFPLAAVTACGSLRALGLSRGPALLGAVLYAALPYHFWRGTVHLYFSAYFLVPPAVLVAWWLSSGGLLAQDAGLRRGRLVIAGIVAVLLGCNMVYYPFFACFLFGVAGTLGYFHRRDLRHLLAALGLVAATSFVLVLNLLPHLLYVRAHGSIAGAQRATMESEMFGLKVAQLLLPVTGHRVRAFAELKGRYNATHPLVNENDWVSLGLLGGVGFLVLLAWMLFVPRPREAEAATDERAPGRLLEHLAVFNGAAVLLGTVGGFSTLFAVLVTPQIRGYNRISVFVAFFAFAAVGLGLDRLRRKLAGPAGPALFAVGLAVVGVFAALDQTGADAHRDWAGLREDFRNDAAFFARIQTALPRGSQVFQLPYEMFPEYGQTVFQMVEYSHFRAYVHTTGLRWSYGSIKGRAADLWARDTAAQPVADMLEALRKARFAGVYVDRDGYADHGAALDAALRPLLGGAPIVCGHGRLAFYRLDLPPGGAPTVVTMPRLPLPPPVFTGGFYGEERDPAITSVWHWCGAEGELRFTNEDDVPRHVRLTGRAVTGRGEPAGLRLRGLGLDEEVAIGADPRVFARTVTLPPGVSVLRFACSAPPLSSGPDPRTLVWMLKDFRVEDAEDAP